MSAAKKSGEVRLRKKTLDGSEAYWGSCVVDRQRRGLAVTRDVYGEKDKHSWSVTHIASGRSVNKQPLLLRDARWLFEECLKRRVAWTKPMRKMLASLSKKERVTLGYLASAALAFSLEKP